MMPKLSGRQILEEMKKKKIKTPVIAVSAVGFHVEIAKELAAK